MAIISGPVSSLQSLGSYAASYTWGPLLSLSRTTILSLLSRIQVGHLKIVDVDGTTTVYGQKHVANGFLEQSVYSIPQTELTVHKDTFWVRMLLFADMVRFLTS